MGSGFLSVWAGGAGLLLFFLDSCEFSGFFSDGVSVAPVGAFCNASPLALAF